MDVILLLIGALTVAQPIDAAQPTFDKPIGELAGKASDDPVDQLSINQLLRLSSLPSARIAEMKCAGLTGWSGAKDVPALALDNASRKIFADKVVAAVARDTDIDPAIVADLITKYADEPDYRKQQGEWPAYDTEIQRDCAPMIAAVKAGTFELSVAVQKEASPK